MSCSVTFSPEVSELVSREVTTEDNFKGKSCKNFSDERHLNISNQFETLMPYSAIYFLGMRALLLQKLATGNSSIGKKRLRFTIFEGGILK